MRARCVGVLAGEGAVLAMTPRPRAQNSCAATTPAQPLVLRVTYHLHHSPTNEKPTDWLCAEQARCKSIDGEVGRRSWRVFKPSGRGQTGSGKARPSLGGFARDMCSSGQLRVYWSGCWGQQALTWTNVSFESKLVD